MFLSADYNGTSYMSQKSTTVTRVDMAKGNGKHFFQLGRPIYGSILGAKNRNRNLDVCRENRSKSIVPSKVHIAPIAK